MRRFRRYSFLALLLLGTQALPAHASDSPRYTSTVIGSIDPMYNQLGTFNNRGDYTMFYMSDSPNISSSVTLLSSGNQTLFRSNGAIRGLNDLGQAVGYDIVDRDGMARTVSILWDGTSSREIARDGVPFWGSAINNRGHIAGGFSTDSFSPTSNYLYDLNTGSFTQIGIGGQLHINSINDDGSAVGWMRTENGNQHAFIYENGTVTDLGTFGGTSSDAISINNRGDFIFRYQDSTSTYLGAYIGGQYIDLPDEAKNSTHVWLSDLGHLVFIGDEYLVWKDGHMAALFDVVEGGERFYPDEIGLRTMNGNGEILAQHCTREMYGFCDIVKFSPVLAVPEPGTWAMLLVGLGMVAVRRRCAIA